MKIFIHAITIMLAQMGVYVWYATADFSREEWCTAYYIWDKIILVLLVLCVINPVKIMLPLWIVTGTFFAIRLLLEFVAISTDITRILFNYHLMFLINLACTLLIILRSLKCPKRN